MGLRNLYKVFRETRNAAREQATLAVTGDSARAAEVAALLGAQRGVRGAEVILAVRDGGATISGKAVEDPGEIPLSSKGGEALLEELTPRIVLALDEDYLVALAKGYPPLRRAVSEEIARHNARQNAVIGALPIPGADRPGQYPLLRTWRPEGGRARDGQHQEPRPQGGQGLRLAPASKVGFRLRLTPVAFYIIGLMFAFVRRVVSEVRTGLSTLRRVGLRILLGLTALQAVIVGVLVALAELRKRRQVPREGFPWEDQPEISLEAGEDRLKIYAYGVNLYQAMLEEIEAAEGEIFVGTFIWKGDEVGRRFMDALA